MPTTTVNHFGNVSRSVKEALVVGTHPQDESLGRGAALGALSERRTTVGVQCSTHGEVSAQDDTSCPLGEIPDEQQRVTTAVLGIYEVGLQVYRYGTLVDVPVEKLANLHSLPVI